MGTYGSIKLLGYNQFLTMVKESVKTSIGEDYHVSLNHIIKNNTIELDGLVILKQNERVTPNIYLNSYYERYLEGEEIAELVKEIIDIYKDTMQEGEREVLCLRYEYSEMKSCIIYRLINYDKNRRLLLEVPHIRIMDLAITFHCLVKNNEEGIGTIRITNEHMESWGVDFNEIKELAMANTPKLFPPIIRSMNEVFLDLFRKDIKNMNDQNQSDRDELIEEASSEELLNLMMKGMGENNSTDMYVLSNIKGINGASCLLYPNLVKNFADNYQSDFYILPSSIHEIILVKDDKRLGKDVLHNMVIDVNQTQVPEEEFLSDHVYYYSREKNIISCKI